MFILVSCLLFGFLFLSQPAIRIECCWRDLGTIDITLKNGVAFIYRISVFRWFYELKKKRNTPKHYLLLAHTSVLWVVVVVVVYVQSHRCLEGQVQSHQSMGFSECWDPGVTRGPPSALMGFLSRSFLQVQYLPFGNRRKLPVSLKDHMGT